MSGAAGHADPPVVSCLMPTRDRRAFVPRAIECFLAQSYPHRELVVLDDGDDPVADLVPDDRRIRYLRTPSIRPLGRKRNRACEEARGEILVHWDDDDYSAPWRLSYQVGRLLATGADACGLDRLWYFEPATGSAWEYVYPLARRPWVAGGSLCYRSDFQRRHPFPELDVGEDSEWLWQHGPAVVCLQDPSFLVADLHDANTEARDTGNGAWKPLPASTLRGVLGEHWWRSAMVPARARPTARAAGPRVSRRASPSAPRSSLPPAPRRGDSAGRPRPRVSCLMPTFQRRGFVVRAIEYFLRQDFTDSELLVLDDGEDAVADLMPPDPRVRYLRLDERRSLGAKLNLGCEEARGEYCLHWDDDDWYAEDRVRRQLAALEESGADLCSLRPALIYELEADRFWSGGDALWHNLLADGSFIGASMAYGRWLYTDGLRFPDVTMGCDYMLYEELKAQGRRTVEMLDDDLFVYLRHGDNTWRFDCGAGESWRSVEPPAFLPARDLAFYRRLAAELAARRGPREPAPRALSSARAPRSRGSGAVRGMGVVRGIVTRRVG